MQTELYLNNKSKMQTVLYVTLQQWICCRVAASTRGAGAHVVVWLHQPLHCEDQPLCHHCGYGGTQDLLKRHHSLPPWYAKFYTTYSTSNSSDATPHISALHQTLQQLPLPHTRNHTSYLHLTADETHHTLTSNQTPHHLPLIHTRFYTTYLCITPDTAPFTSAYIRYCILYL